MIQPLIDEQGRVTLWPSKRSPTSRREAILAYLVEKVDPARTYSEREISALLNEWHTFGDAALLRREMVDRGFLTRTPDCREYRRRTP